MAGRPRKVIDISTGKIGKKEINNRQKQEEKLKLGRDQLTAPAWLSKNAKKEFEKIVTEAGKINLLDNLDLTVLAIYCNAAEGYEEMAKMIAEEGAVLQNDKGAMFTNPALVAQEKYVKQIMQCSTKLGLATTDRLKLIVPTKEDTRENKFIELIKSKKQG